MACDDSSHSLVLISCLLLFLADLPCSLPLHGHAKGENIIHNDSGVEEKLWRGRAS